MLYLLKTPRAIKRVRMGTYFLKRRKCDSCEQERSQDGIGRLPVDMIFDVVDGQGHMGFDRIFGNLQSLRRLLIGFALEFTEFEHFFLLG